MAEGQTPIPGSSAPQQQQQPSKTPIIYICGGIFGTIMRVTSVYCMSCSEMLLGLGLYKAGLNYYLECFNGS